MTNGGCGPATVRYVFVDGNYLREAFDSGISAFFESEARIDFNALRGMAQSSKLFYYDSVNAQPRTGETPEQTAARIAAADAELDRIQATPGCHVREGSVTGRDQRRRRQKQVDVLLAVEMLTHAFHRNFERVVLVAGDLDFKPLVDSLVSLGIFTEVWYERKHAAEALLAAADLRQELTIKDFYALSEGSFREAHTMPTDVLEAHRDRYDWPVVRRGTFNGHACFIGQHGQTPPYTLVVDRYDGRLDLHVSYYNRDKLALYFSMVFGDVMWE